MEWSPSDECGETVTEIFLNWRMKLLGYVSTTSSQSLVEGCPGRYELAGSSGLLHMLLGVQKPQAKEVIQILVVASRTSMYRNIGQAPTSREM